MQAPTAPPQSLPDDAVVELDPAVEILDTEVDEFSLLCQTDLAVGMAVPPGEGLLDFVRSLMGKPVRLGALRAEYDDRALVDEMLSSLLAHGFAHIAPPDGPPPQRPLRRAVVIDLDAVAAPGTLGALWSAGEAAPEVLLRCARLSDHNATLRELARRRAAGALRAHHVVIRARDVRCDDDLRAALVRLGAAVQIDGVAWPVAHGSIPGLAALTHGLVATHVIMAPGASILDESMCERCVAWCQSEFVSGLCLRLDPATIAQDAWPAVFDAVHALETALGDVVVTNMPGDEVLLGNTDRGWLGEDRSEAERRFRLAYLRWRIPLVKASEGDCPWSQIPEVEEQWIRSAEDLLPNHPELLQLAPGSSIVDVCGGLGRVARRLSPAVGPAGIVISIEMRRFLTERARRFACEGNFTNLQFRPGRAERVPLPDGAVDAAVNEWTGAIWELGLGPTMVKEMVRVVRPGGRIAVTHRLAQLQLDALDKPWVQYAHIYQWVRDAFSRPELTIVAERVWGQTLPSKAGQNATLWVEQYLPRLVNPHDRIFSAEESDQEVPRADVYLTMIAERRKP
jgi:ubiquinone/menaquinone biosynthesis C-methylase UbiE